jgi:phosphoglucosamine mutase
MGNKKYFGTDGIRGRVGDSNVNPEFVLKLGWAVGRVLTNGHRKKVIIGKDTRVSGYMLESALEAGLSAAGVDVRLLGPMPTPAIAYLTQTLRACAGIVISASHNMFEDNGIKFFGAEGTKLPDTLECAIEAYIQKPMKTVPSSQLGKAMRIDDAPGRYIEFCKSTIPSLTRLTGLKIVVDCANGATYHIAPNVFKELGADVVVLANEPDGFNINEKCGSTQPELLSQKVIDEKADIGIALDGDGDRVILVDANGTIIDGDQVIYIIARDRLNKGLLRGGVVGTVMSNLGLEKAIIELGLEFCRANVGDRYVLETLRQKQWLIGGEPSGHIVCLDKTTTGDGIIAALQVLAIMSKKNLNLNELAKDVELYPQYHINIKTSKAHELMGNTAVKKAINDVEQTLAGIGRILVRPSGTEPVLRIMVEGNDEANIKTYAKQLEHFVSSYS